MVRAAHLRIAKKYVGAKRFSRASVKEARRRLSNLESCRAPSQITARVDPDPMHLHQSVPSGAQSAPEDRQHSVGAKRLSRASVKEARRRLFNSANKMA